MADKFLMRSAEEWHVSYLEEEERANTLQAKLDAVREWAERASKTEWHGINAYQDAAVEVLSLLSDTEDTNG